MKTQLWLASLWLVLGCDEDCLLCVGSQANECIRCGTNASLVPVHGNYIGSCVCNASYCPQPNAMSCGSGCDPSCSTCSGCGANQCTACKDGATLSSGTCTCQTPNFCVMDASGLCQAGCTNSECLTCNSCSNDSACTKCSTGASLKDNHCYCTSGFKRFDVTNLCVSCEPPPSDSHMHPDDWRCNRDSGFFPNRTSRKCDACNPLCKECRGSSANDCTSCKDNHAHVSGNTRPDCNSCKGNSGNDRRNLDHNRNSGTCTCNKGYFPSPDANNCSQCDPTCIYCSGSGANACLQCTSTMTLNGPPPTSCFCPSGSSCVTCDSTCETCQGTGPDQCLTCVDNNASISTSPGTCACVSGYFGTPNSCTQCDTSCQACSDGTSCDSCYSNADLNGSAICECNIGYFPLPDPANCQPCDSMCRTCSSQTTCLSCNNGAALQTDSSCVCIEGYYGSPVSCAPCVRGCQVCNAVGCTQCSTNWYLYEKSCVTTCPLGYFAQNSICEHGDLIPPDPSMFVNQNNSLTVSFSKPINMNLTASDINIAVTDTAHVSYSLVWSNPLVLNQSSLLLTLTIDSPTLPDDNQCQLTFLHPSTVVDLLGVALVKDQLLGVLYGFGKATYNATMKANAATVAQGSVGAVAATSIMSGSPGSFWSLLNQLQLITYIPMTTMPVPSGLMATLGALNVGTFVPNPFTYFLPNNDTSQSPPDYAQRYGVNSSLFLLNTGLMTSIAVALFLSFIPMYLFSKLTTGFLSQYFRRILPSFKWGIPLRWWIQSYLDISIYSLLEIQQILTHNGLSAVSVSINFLLSLVLTCCALLTPLLAYVFLWKHYNQMASRKESVFNKRWGEFYMEFDEKQSLGGLMYYPLFLTRRLVYALTIIWMAAYPEVQALINTSMALAVPLT